MPSRAKAIRHRQSFSARSKSDGGASVTLRLVGGARRRDPLERVSFYGVQRNSGRNVMLTDAQVAVLCDIAQSIAFADDRQGEVDRLMKEGYVAKDGDLYQLTPKAEKVLSDRGAGLNES